MLAANVLLVEALSETFKSVGKSNSNSKSPPPQNNSQNLTMPTTKKSPSMDESYKENIIKNENLYSLIGVDNSGDKKTNVFNPPPAPNTGVRSNTNPSARGTFLDLHWTDLLEGILILSLVVFLFIKLRQCYNRMRLDRKKRRQELMIAQFKELGNPFLTQGGGGGAKNTQSASIHELPELNWESMFQPKN